VRPLTVARTLAGESAVTHAPRVFVSYSWDSEEHKLWVRKLCKKLRRDGLDARLDCWHNLQNKTIPDFMNSEIRAADRILIVCTPKYRKKVHAMENGDSVSGSGWEAMLVTSGVFSSQHTLKKVLPILAAGRWSQAAPSWMSALEYVDLSNKAAFRRNYHVLLERLAGTTAKAPPLGPPPVNLEPGSMESPARNTEKYTTAHTEVSEPRESYGTNLKEKDRDYGTRFVEEELPRIIARAQTRGQLTAVVFVDIDDLSKINEHHSPEIGDVVLDVVYEEVRRRSAAQYRGRCGADTFYAVILGKSPTTLQDKVSNFCAKLRKEIEGYWWESVAPDLHVTCTIGYSVARDNDNPQDLLARSLRGMLYGKKEGGNRVRRGPMYSGMRFERVVYHSDSGKHDDINPLVLKGLVRPERSRAVEVESFRLRRFIS
jgi:diguanylate cyclase (GGDEF)-like protein